MALRSIVDLPAPAKLNLFLHVVGRRADGYHALESLLVPIDWCDTLHVERRDDGHIARHDLGEPLPPDDLCRRAAAALQQASATPHGVDISIEKRVPSGAGLGGGSSDAATVLLALNRLWQLDWPLERLLRIGVALGADVPFFLSATPALASGIGERLQPVAHTPACFAVVKPAVGLATRDVFAARSAAAAVPGASSEGSAAARISGFSGNAGPEGSQWSENSGRNDLEAAAEALCPDVTRALALLREHFGAGRMTGSGSAVFVRLLPGAEAAPGLPPLPPGWQGRICRSLQTHPLSGWARSENVESSPFGLDRG